MKAMANMQRHHFEIIMGAINAVDEMVGKIFESKDLGRVEGDVAIPAMICRRTFLMDFEESLKDLVDSAQRVFREQHVEGGKDLHAAKDAHGEGILIDTSEIPGFSDQGFELYARFMGEDLVNGKRQPVAFDQGTWELGILNDDVICLEGDSKSKLECPKRISTWTETEEDLVAPADGDFFSCHVLEHWKLVTLPKEVLIGKLNHADGKSLRALMEISDTKHEITNALAREIGFALDAGFEPDHVDYDDRSIFYMDRSSRNASR